MNQSFCELSTCSGYEHDGGFPSGYARVADELPKSFVQLFTEEESKQSRKVQPHQRVSQPAVGDFLPFFKSLGVIRIGKAGQGAALVNLTQQEE